MAMLIDIARKLSEYTNSLLSRWRDAGVFVAVNHHSGIVDCERVWRDTSANITVIDIWSVETGGSRGYDFGKKMKE